MSAVTALLLIATVLIASCAAAQPEGFREHGTFLGIGSCLKQLVGPGPEAGSERVYASHVYGGDCLDVVATDPLTGETDVFPSPLPGETGAWAMALGADGQVYIGTLPRAHVMRVDWPTKTLVDMGRPSETEQYIWQLALGTDNKLYGCTYPSAKLVRFDPATGEGEDLGRMDEEELYGRYVAADDNGFIYIGIGTSKRHLVAYEIATGEHRDVLTPEMSGDGSCSVGRGIDGVVYGIAGGQSLRMDGFTPVPIEAGDVRGPGPLTLADGSTVTHDGATVSITDAATDETATHPTGYQGKSQSLFRIGLGPDGLLYGSTAMPIHFLRADPDGTDWEELGQPGGGEFYSFLAHGDVLIGAAYSGHAPIMIYRPGEPYAPSTEPTGNPRMIHYEGENSGWRPMAMIEGPDGEVIIGAVSGYGKLGGPICVLDPETGEVEQYMHVVEDESVIALAALADGLIVGGTTTSGGGGSHATQTEATLLLWDPETREKVFETIPAPGQATVAALAGGADGLVYGFAGSTMFVFDPEKREIVRSAEHGLGAVQYNAVAMGPDGELVGVASGGVFALDAATGEPRVLASYPGGITGGFAVRGRDVFFTSGPTIVSYAIPE